MSDLFAQFVVNVLYPLNLFGLQVPITNSSLMMILATLMVTIFMIILYAFWKKNSNWIKNETKPGSEIGFFTTEWKRDKKFYTLSILFYFTIISVFFWLYQLKLMPYNDFIQLGYIWFDCLVFTSTTVILYNINFSSFPLMITYLYFFLRTMVKPLAVHSKSDEEHHDHHPMSHDHLSVVLTVFFLILCGNLLGLIPYFFTFTSQIINTAVLATFVSIATILIGLKNNGLKFFTLFTIKGLPSAMQLIVVPIEIASFILRVLSLSMRLFANMMVGHCILKVCAGFSESMGMFGFIPIAPTVLLMFMEFGVAFLQAYVFALLTTMYIKESIELH